LKRFAIGLALVISSAASATGYLDHPSAKDFIDRMVTEHSFDRQYIESILAQAEKKQPILDAISRPAEKTMPWYEYRKIFLKPERIEGGVKFWQENQSILHQVEKDFGVSAQIIVAIIGVETRYGGYMGNYRVLDALVTLGFDYPPRSTFFAKQLEEFLLLSREQQQDPLALKGSYAGAMGYGQFIPSSYRSFAKDYDGDGFADIWNNKKDAIASVANYFKAHGWQHAEPVAEPAKRSEKFKEDLLNANKRPTLSAIELSKLGFAPLADREALNKPAMALQFEAVEGDEFWLGYNNFYVITRYNRSQLYALAVYQLSEAIALAYKNASTEKL
jgi:membrane-bound lytic murein transglycosylase B